VASSFLYSAFCTDRAIFGLGLGVPTNGRDFEILFRLYGPEKAFFDKAWKLPDVEDVR
jgi:hypothetical protein